MQKIVYLLTTIDGFFVVQSDHQIVTVVRADRHTARVEIAGELPVRHGGALEYRVVHGVPRQFIDEIVFSKVIHG